MITTYEQYRDHLARLELKFPEDQDFEVTHGTVVTLAYHFIRTLIDKGFNLTDLERLVEREDRLSTGRETGEMYSNSLFKPKSSILRKKHYIFELYLEEVYYPDKSKPNFYYNLLPNQEIPREEVVNEMKALLEEGDLEVAAILFMLNATEAIADSVEMPEMMMHELESL